MMRIFCCLLGVLVCTVGFALCADSENNHGAPITSNDNTTHTSSSPSIEDPERKKTTTSLPSSTTSVTHSSSTNGTNAPTLSPTTSPSTTQGTSTTTPSSTTSPSSTHGPTPTIPPSSTHGPTPTIPSSSTHGPSSTTPSPITVAPEPASAKGSWNVTEKNSTCIKLEGVIIVNIKYTTKNETTHKEINHVYNVTVPKFATATGSCKNEEIALQWQNNTLKFIFQKNVTSHENDYALTNIVGKVLVPATNSTTDFNFNHSSKYFVTPLNQSYSCSAVKQVNVNDKVNVQLEDFKLQAFKTSKGSGFDQSLDCSNSPATTPDIVPIIVGCVLALLIICILVAYLISRRRSQARGYLSM